MAVLLAYPTVGAGGDVIPADAPFTVTIQDWTTGSAVEVGSLDLDQNGTPMVMEDAGMAAAMGTVNIRQSPTTVVFGDFEFGAICFDAPAQCNENLTDPLYQVLIGCKPYGRWSSYPARDTWVQATDKMFPPAFKAVIKKQDGTVLHTHELHDGLPINDPSVNYLMWFDESYTAGALRPHWNIAAILPWQSARPSVSPDRATYFNGMTADSLRASASKQEYSFNPQAPLLVPSSGNAQVNGAFHWFGAPRWPQPTQNGYSGTYTGKGTDDPYLGTGSGSYLAPQWASGWKYEPGSISCHDHYTGPGGPRADRCVIPLPIAIWGTDQSWVRIKEDEPIRDMVEDWLLSYYNFPVFYIQDLQTFAMLPNAEIIPGDTWSYFDSYYNGASTGGMLDSKLIDQRANRNGSDYELNDTSGRFVWNGYASDMLHNYNTTAWGALLFNSPMHVYGAKAFYQVNRMASLFGGAAGSIVDLTSLAGSPPKWDDFLSRAMAWRLMHHVFAWKLATTNTDLGYTRASIEAELIAALELIDTDIRQVVAVSSDAYSEALKRFGVPIQDVDQGDGTHRWQCAGNTKSLSFYHAHILALMKQTGCWDAVRAASASAAAGLDFIVECLDRYSIEWCQNPATTAYENDVAGDFLGPAVASATPLTASHLYADWAAQAAAVATTADWIHDAGGALVPDGRSVTQHLRAQYIFMRRDFFPEIVHADLTSACTIMQDYYDEIEAAVTAAVGNANKRNADWSYRHAGLGFLAAPP